MNQRNIKYIVVHCTATPTTTTLESIKRYWKEQRGWGDTPGYHYFIKRDGTVVQLLDEKKNSYGVYKHNSECISIAYVGGIDKDGKPVDNRSDAQKHAMFDIIVRLTEKYPKAEVLGHRDFPGVKKACPCFDVKEWLKNYEPDFNSEA
jgi:N-acetylmuramoyl-L-alanine amidase